MFVVRLNINNSKNSMELPVIPNKFKFSAFVLGLVLATTSFAACRFFWEQLSDGSWVQFEICCWDNRCEVMSVTLHPRFEPREGEQ